MKTFDLRNNRIREYERRVTNITQCLAEKRDGHIHFRLPMWMKEQINKSGKSEADFIIAKLAEDLYKPMEIDEEAWAEEIKNL